MSPAAEAAPPLAAVAQFLRERTGLAFRAGRLADLEAGLARAVARSGAADPGEYLARLREDEAALDDLVSEVAVGETYFFREPGQWEFLRRVALPDLASRRVAGHPLRAWSAGCATGEEPATLAIVLEEEGWGGRASILATDISRPALARARRGRYGAWSLRGAGEGPAARWFSREGDRWILDPRIRDRVAYEYLNLALDHWPSLPSGVWGMDLVLCRNVLIYFEREAIRGVARRLWASLAEGGWVVAGPSDPPLADEAPFETVVTPSGVFYRRAAARAPGLPPPAGVAPEPEPPAPAADAPPPASDAVPEPSPAPPPPAPPGPEERARIIRALANERGAAEAEREAAEAAGRFPLSPELRLLRAILLAALSRDDEAIRELRRALYLDRGLAAAHFTLASLLRRRGDAAGARRSYESARALAAARPPEEPVALFDGEPAGRLAEASRVQLSLLEAVS